MTEVSAKKLYRVLHLEDVLGNAELVARELEKSNIEFELCAVESEAEYLRALDKSTPDIILCDHSLASFTPLKALRILKEKKLHIPFIMITSFAGEDAAMDVVREGADDYILPNRVMRLSNVVVNNIEKYRHEKERKQLIDNACDKETITEEALNRLSNKLSLATKSAGIGVWEYIIAEQRFIHDNVLLSIYKSTQNEFDGSLQNWLNYVHPEDRDGVKQKFEYALQNTGIFEMQYRIIWKNGSIRCLNATIFVERDNDGNIKQALGTNRDITAHKQAEQAIKESEIKYRSFFESSIDGILLIDDGSIVSANPAACEIFRMTEEEICQAGQFSLLDEEDAHVQTLLKQQQQENGKAKGEVTFKRKDGTTFESEISSASFIDDHGIKRTSIIFRDITNIKAASQRLLATTNALQNAVNDLKKIMDSSLDVICTIDNEGKFVSVSAAAEAVWGYSPDELKGRKYLDMVYDEDVKKTIEVGARIESGESFTMFENRYIHKNGSIVPVLWSATWDERDKLMYCIAKDATEKKRLEKAFEDERQRFYEVFQHAPCSVGIFKGKDHVFQLANNLYLELAERKDIIGKTVREVFPEIENQGLFELLDSVYATGKTFSAEERLVRVLKSNGGELKDVYLNFVYQAYRNYNNEIEGIFFFAINVTEPVEARKEIEASEKRFRQLIQNLPEALYTCDKDGRIILYNEAAVKLWGRKPEFEKDLWWGAVKIYNEDGSQLAPAACPLALTIRNDKECVANAIIVEKPGGERRYVKPNPIPIFDRYDKVTGAVNMLVDITHIKEVEEKLRTSNERYQIVIKATNDAICDWNLKTNEIYWNESYERIFGHKTTDGKFEIDDYFNQVHINDRKRVKVTLSDVLTNLETYWQDEYKYYKANGDAADVFARGYWNYDESNKPERFVVAMQDVTGRKLSEKKLLEYQEQLLESQRIAHIGSWQLNFINGHDLTSNPIHCSEETFKIFGFTSSKEIVHFKTFAELIHPEDRQMVTDLFEKTIRKKSSYSVDFRIMKPNGEQRWVYQQARIITDAMTGEVVKMFGTNKDITIRKEQEIKIEKNVRERELLIRELTRSIADLKQFTFITSHNFRAPLSNLLGLLSLIEEKTLSEHNLEVLSMFKTSTYQLNKTIDDLMAVLVIKNNVNVSLTNINLDDVINEVCSSLVFKIIGIDCTINRHLKVSTLKFSKAYLESILMNLLSNAIRYRSLKRKLQINIATEEGSNGDVILTVEDNGIGIDIKRHKHNLFGLYQRFHANSDGAGLGLFMVKSQVTALGGTIEVNSEVEKGTKFDITFKAKS